MRGSPKVPQKCQNAYKSLPKVTKIALAAVGLVPPAVCGACARLGDALKQFFNPALKKSLIIALAGRSFGWLVGWLVGLLVGWLVGGLVGWLAGWLDGWLVQLGWLVCWLVGCFFGWLVGLGDICPH